MNGQTNRAWREGPVEANEIAPRLWMGSRPEPGPKLRACGVDILVLCAMEYQPQPEWYPGVDVQRIHLDDAELPGREALEAFQLASHLAKELKRGRCVLVTCQQGRNRSGLITALALTQFTGCSGIEAAHAVRARRLSPFGPALSNHHYVEALSTVAPARIRGVMTETARRNARLVG
jgi:hypothetical protein